MAKWKLVKFLQQTDGDLRKKTIRAGAWVGISSTVLSSLSFIRSIVLARLLSPEIFGLWAICMMYIRGINVLTETGFGAALIHRQEAFEEARDTAYTLMVVRGVLLALVTVLMARMVADFFGHEILQLLVSVLALALLFSGFANMNAVHKQKELDFKSLVYLEQIHTLVYFTLVVGLAYFYRNIWSLVCAHVVSSLVYVVLSFVIIPGRPKFEFDKKIAAELFGYGKYITGLTIVIFVTTEIDNAVVGKVLGMEALGFYVLAYTLANLPATHFSKLLSRILFPAYSKLQNDRAALQYALTRAIRFVSVVTIPACFVFIALADELIVVVYGEKWLPAANALKILAVFGMLRAISSLSGYVYNAVGKPNISFYLNSGKLALIAIIIIPLSQHYGIEGAAIAVTAPLFLQFFVGIYMVCRITGADYWDILASLLRITLISSLVTFLLFFLKKYVDGDGVVGLILLLMSSALFFFVFLLRDIKGLYMAVFTSSESSLK